MSGCSTLFKKKKGLAYEKEKVMVVIVSKQSQHGKYGVLINMLRITKRRKY